MDRRTFLLSLPVLAAAGLAGCEPAVRRRPPRARGPLGPGVALSSARLPEPAWDQAAVWDGRRAYLFGGWTGSGYLDEILFFDPALQTLTAADARLPFGRNGVRAAWIDGAAYIFGGGFGFPPFSRFTAQIVRYDPLSGRIRVMRATLPEPRFEFAVASDGQYAYILGGKGYRGLTADILCYDPAADRVVRMQAQLPSPRHVFDAVWTGREVLAFGGRGDPRFLDEIVRYDPVRDQVEVMPARLPTPRWGAAAVWTGSLAYIFGGGEGGAENTVAQIVRYDPGRNALEVMPGGLPSGRCGMPAIWDGQAAYVFGGTETDTTEGTPVDEIVCYTPGPDTLRAATT